MNNNLGAGIFFMIAFLMVFAPLMCGMNVDRYVRHEDYEGLE